MPKALQVNIGFDVAQGRWLDNVASITRRRRQEIITWCVDALMELDPMEANELFTLAPVDAANALRQALRSRGPRPSQRTSTKPASKLA